MMTTGIYAGSFDPLTLGHYSVISQATQVFDQVIVAVGANGSKEGLFSTDERMFLIREVISPLNNVRVVSFNGLLAGYCKSLAIKGGKVAIVRGLRAVSDFEQEMAIANLNLKINPNAPTVFFPTEPSRAFVSSSAAKELARFEGTREALLQYVHPVVADALIARLGPVQEAPLDPEDSVEP